MTMPEGPLVPILGEDVRGLVRLGIVQATPIKVAPSGRDLEDEIETLASTLRDRYGGRAPAEITPLVHARDLYKAFGIDPTRTRPSSEALLRRALKGKSPPRISNAVDVCNLCSLRYLLPIGLYDLALARPPITLRRGRPGEAYPGIRKDDVHVHGRPVLVDEDGPFGNPTSDSLRTSVTGSTRSLYMVIFGPAAYPADLMERNVRDACGAMERHLAPPEETVSAVGRVL